MKISQHLPPDVLSWQQLYQIFEQAGQTLADEVTYLYPSAGQRKTILEVYRYQMQHIKDKANQEVETGELDLDKEEWDKLYSLLLTSPVPIPFALVDKVKRLRALAAYR